MCEFHHIVTDAWFSSHLLHKRILRGLSFLEVLTILRGRANRLNTCLCHMKFWLYICSCAVLGWIHVCRVLLNDYTIQGCLNNLCDIWMIAFRENFNLFNEALKCLLLAHACRFTHFQEFNGDSLPWVKVNCKLDSKMQIMRNLITLHSVHPPRCEELDTYRRVFWVAYLQWPRLRSALTSLREVSTTCESCWSCACLKRIAYIMTMLAKISWPLVWQAIYYSPFGCVLLLLPRLWQVSPKFYLMPVVSRHHLCHVCCLNASINYNQSNGIYDY